VRTRFLLVVLALAAFALSAATASADPKKPYTVRIAPASAVAGSETTFTVTLTNNAKQTLGAANIYVPTVPSPFIFVNPAPSTTRGTVTRSDSVLQLRDLSLSTNASVTVTLGLKMPCKAGDYKWRVEAKQSNDFHGAGNDMGPISGSLTTTVTGASGGSTLQFLAEPASAEKNAQIRAEAFQPASLKLVRVQVLDACGGAVTGTVQLHLNTADGPLVASSELSGGVASFENLSIAQSGNYTLVAVLVGGGSTPDVSQRFQIIDVVEDCTPASCTATIEGEENSVTMTGTGGSGTGFALLSLNLGTDPLLSDGCAAYAAVVPDDRLPDWYEFNTTVDRIKTLDVVYDAEAVRAIGGVSKLQICFAAPIQFKDKSGKTALRFDYDGLEGNGAEGYAGLLADCPYKSTDRTEPCILKRQPLDDDRYDAYGHPSGGSRALVRVFVPLRFDPRMH
jgi:hypothetical protein